MLFRMFFCHHLDEIIVATAQGCDQPLGYIPSSRNAEPGSFFFLELLTHNNTLLFSLDATTTRVQTSLQPKRGSEARK